MFIPIYIFKSLIFFNARKRITDGENENANDEIFTPPKD